MLGTTLASVIGQRRAPDEIVIVDDGSDDDTARVAERWSTTAPVRVIRQENQGPAAARRAGVAVTTSDLLAFVDADDVWLPDHLEVAAAEHARRGGLVSPDALTWRPGHRLPRRSRRARYPVPAAKAQRVAILRRNFVFSSVVVARDDYESAGGYRDGVTGAEDWDLWIRMIRNGVVVRGTTPATWLYRVDTGSLTDRPEMRSTYCEVLRRSIDESVDDIERRAARDHIERLEARQQLDRAYAAARSGESATARGVARSISAGTPRVRGEALALSAAPVLATRVGDRARDRWAAARR